MKILIVRFKQIGDAIMSAGLCKMLKDRYPEAKIDFVLYDYVAPLFKNQSYVNDIIVINNDERENFFKYLKKVYTITRNDYDIVIDTMSTPKSEFFSLFSRKAKYKIGFKRKRRGYTYTHRYEEVKGLDMMENYIELLKNIDGFELRGTKDYVIDYTEEEVLDLKNRMIEGGVDFNKIIIPLAINSRRAHKVYPIDFMKKVAEELLNKYDSQLILYYSPDEKEFAKKFHEGLNWDKRILSDIKTYSIRDLGALFKNCDIFVGNEGGPRHLAQAIGLPGVAVFCPSGDRDAWALKDRPMYDFVAYNDCSEGIDTSNMTLAEKYQLIKPNFVLDRIHTVMTNYVDKYKKLIKWS